MWLSQIEKWISKHKVGASKLAFSVFGLDLTQTVSERKSNKNPLTFFGFRIFFPEKYFFSGRIFFISPLFFKKSRFSPNLTQSPNMQISLSVDIISSNERFLCGDNAAVAN